MLQYPIVVLISFLVMIGDTEQSSILYVFFEEMLVQDLGQLFNRIIIFLFLFLFFFFLLLSYRVFLYILKNNLIYFEINGLQRLLCVEAFLM